MITESAGQKAGTALLTLGRLPKGLDIARCLAKAGWRVLVAEPGRRHLCGSSRFVAGSFQVTAPVNDPEAYLAELLQIIKTEAVTLVVPVSEECLHAAALHERVPEGVRVAAMPLAQLLSVHGKASFVETCERLAIGAPKTLRLSDPDAPGMNQSGPVIIKRDYSCAGVGLEVVAAGQALPKRDDAQQWLVQQFISGTELCTFSLAFEGRVLGTVVYRGTVVSGTVAVCFERIDAPDKVTQWVNAFIQGAGCSGFIGFDLMIDDGGEVFGLECNPRATSGLHFFQPEDLAAAIVDPARCQQLRLRRRRLMQQFYPCLTETQLSLFRFREFIHNLGQLLRAKDVSFMLRDPLPFLLLPYTAWSILFLTLFKGMSFGQAATWDVEWTAPDETHHD